MFRLGGISSPRSHQAQVGRHHPLLWRGARKAQLALEQRLTQAQGLGPLQRNSACAAADFPVPAPLSSSRIRSEPGGRG